LAGAVLMAILGAATAAHADPAPREVTGDSTTNVIVPPAQPLDATAPAPGHAVMWTKIASASDAVTAPLWAPVAGDSALIAGGNVGLSKPLSLGLFGGKAFLSGRFSAMSSQLTLRPPAILGVQPLLALGYSQLFSNPSGFAEIGARFEDGPLHLGWYLHLAERFNQSGGLPFITSTSYARYVTRRWDFGVDHVAQFSPWGSAFRRDPQFLTVSAGAKTAPDAPTVRIGTTVPLRPVAIPTTRLTMFGTF
jgi:hypothetical protein